MTLTHRDLEWELLLFFTMGSMRWKWLFICGCLGLTAAQAELRENSVGQKLALIPAGTQVLGSSPTEKGHRSDEKERSVSLTRSFYLGTTEVTQGQWHSLMGTTFSDLVNQQEGPAGRGAKLKSTPSAEGSNQPMVFVNWPDALAFCDKLTAKEQTEGLISKKARYGLPTEAEWEYACRAGTRTVFHYGDTLTSDIANFYGKKPYGIKAPGVYREKTTPVGRFAANRFGLHDMHGNVYEWCRDWYQEEANGGTDPVGPSSGDGRIIRGGAWDRQATSCRAAYRYSRDPVRRSHNIGFRVALYGIDAAK